MKYIMKKTTKNPTLGKKVMYGVAIAGVAVGILGGAGYLSVHKDNQAMSADLTAKQADIVSLNSKLDANEISMETFQKNIDAIGVELVDLKETSIADKASIAVYAVLLE